MNVFRSVGLLLNSFIQILCNLILFVFGQIVEIGILHQAGAIIKFRMIDIVRALWRKRSTLWARAWADGRLLVLLLLLWGLPLRQGPLRLIGRLRRKI